MHRLLSLGGLQVSRLTITLQEDEKVALGRLSEKEKRDPRDQAALLIRNELERRGLLPANVVVHDAKITRDAAQMGDASAP